MKLNVLYSSHIFGSVIKDDILGGWHGDYLTWPHMQMNFNNTPNLFLFEVLLLGDENGCSPLHHACSVDVVDTIEIVLDAAAEADEKLLEDVVMKKDNEGEFSRGFKDVLLGIPKSDLLGVTVVLVHVAGQAPYIFESTEYM